MKKIGRNDPCTCGSGKKFKQCCMLRNDTQVSGINASEDPVTAMLKTAIAHLGAGRVAEAENLYQEILHASPEQPEALHYLGVIAHGRNDFTQAIDLIGNAIRLNSSDAYAHCNMGNALLALGRHADALASYERALDIDADFVQALYNRGNALLDTRRYDDALISFDRVLKIKPDFSEALCNRGNALLGLKQHEQALVNFDQAIEISPHFVEAICNRGSALQALKQFDAALGCYSKALQINPAYASAYNSLGSAYQDMYRFDDARSCYAKALELKPDYAEAHLNLGTVWQALKNPEAALACYGAALQVRTDYMPAMINLGSALQQLKRFDDAAVCYKAILDLDPSHRYALGLLANCALNVCDWPMMERCTPVLRESIARGDAVSMPFTLLGFPLSGAEQLAGAKSYLRDTIGESTLACSPERHAHDRVRVAYLSADFHQHPTACLMAELFELHDRDQFEIIGISFGPEDHSLIRARLVAAFDHFHDVRTMSDLQTASLMRELEVDIAVDLKGYTQDARPGILSHRPAPIQVSYLGYPGTTGADFLDYIIADKHVLPFGQQTVFSEKIVHLPECYQVNDSTRVMSPWQPTRKECGLPESGFVFCCFNNNYKITPTIFDIWMRLLHSIEGSVLWLLHDNDTARANLEHQASVRGIDPRRLVFAPRMTVDLHLARHGLADLFIDTLPINAHTTASDALWTGLPVLTCTGETFAGRVAGSLLYAVGLPELVTEDLVTYEAMAQELASDAFKLQSLRQKLGRNKEKSSLFNADRFRRQLESAYRTMWTATLNNQQPEGFAVAANLENVFEGILVEANETVRSSIDEAAR